jgi:hypothetical protein
MNMPANTPLSSLPYPLPSEPVASGAANIQALATALDAGHRPVVNIGTGTFAGGIPVGGNAATGTLTFARPFPVGVTPIVVGSYAGAGVYMQMAINVVSNTQVSFMLRNNGGGVSTNGTFFYIAMS